MPHTKGLALCSFCYFCHIPQVNNQGNVTEAVHIASAAVDIITFNLTDVRPANVQQAAHHCLSLAHQLRELSMDMSPALRLLSELDPAEFQTRDDAVIFTLGDLLYRSSVREQQHILKFGNFKSFGLIAKYLFSSVGVNQILGMLSNYSCRVRFYPHRADG